MRGCVETDIEFHCYRRQTLTVKREQLLPHFNCDKFTEELRFLFSSCLRINFCFLSLLSQTRNDSVTFMAVSTKALLRKPRRNSGEISKKASRRNMKFILDPMAYILESCSFWSNNLTSNMVPMASDSEQIQQRLADPLFYSMFQNA